jgi:hypothetical protein
MRVSPRRRNYLMASGVMSAGPPASQEAIMRNRKSIMKTLLVAFGFLAAAAVIGTPAQAQNYPWCAQYGSGFGASNCGFSNLQQCQADISGIGGFCAPNTLYQPPAAPHRRRAQP